MLLLEYMEEHPPLLARPGMGVRVTTYFRKTVRLRASLALCTAREGGGGGGTLREDQGRFVRPHSFNDGHVVISAAAVVGSTKHF
jgi:hypothetical protein